jgi:hypothetical protein
MNLIERRHAIPRGNVLHILAYRRNLSRNLKAQGVGELEGEAGRPLTHVDVDVVHGARTHPDEDFSRAGSRLWDILIEEFVNPAVFVKAHSLHRVSSVDPMGDIVKVLPIGRRDVPPGDDRDAVHDTPPLDAHPAPA